MRITDLLESVANGVYYHGTNKNFVDFDIGASRVNRGSNVTGIYFTPSESEAQTYGSRVIRATLDVRKPFYHSSRNKITEEMKVVARQQLYKYTTYKENWLDTAIIPDFVERGNFSRLSDVNGDIKREILIAGGYDSFIDGRHVVVLTPTKKNIKVI